MKKYSKFSVICLTIALCFEYDKVDLVVGPLSGSEGIAVKNYAKTQPQVTFLNGASAAQDTTLRDPAPNFFRWQTEGAQWMAGLGEYAYKVNSGVPFGLL